MLLQQFSISGRCTFNIISVVAALDYGGNSIGVGLVTRVFFSAPAKPHQPPDHETADRGGNIQPSAQKYSQMIAAPRYYIRNILK